MAIWACTAVAAPPSSSASETVLSRDFMVIGVSSGSFVEAILVRPVPTSMRKRVEFPVSLDLPPAMREAVRLEHQKRDDDQPDRDLAQKSDVVVERQCLVDGAPFEAGADPLYRFRQQHHESGAHQRAHDRTGAPAANNSQRQDRAFDAEALI